MKEEKRDQMIRESLDQYLAGIDTLPSRRAEITRALTGQTPLFRRAAFRAVAVPAALTLLLCVGIGIFAGLQNGIARPDSLRKPDTVAVQPQPTGFVALAQPEGEGGETDSVPAGANGIDADLSGAVVPTVEPEPEVTVRLAEFISLWREHRWEDMLAICAPEWISEFKDPESELADLASFITPGAFEIENVTERETMLGRGYLICFTIRDENNPDALYRASVYILHETEGRWVVSPQNLKYYEVLSPRELWEATEESRLTKALEKVNPDLAAAMVPVGLSCENDGLRLEIISAALSEQDALVVFSLHDPEGNRITGDTKFDFISLDLSGAIGNRSSYMPYSSVDPEQHKAVLAEYIHYNEPTFSPSGTDGQFFISISNPETMTEKETDLIPLLRQYGELSGTLTDPPEAAFSNISNQMYNGSELREMGIRVLDPSRSLEVPLGDHVILDGIRLGGDGKLHIQLHYPESGHLWYPVVIFASGIPFDGPDCMHDRIISVAWNEKANTMPGSRLDMQLQLDGEIEDDASLKIMFCDVAIMSYGEWHVAVPAEQIWAGTGDTADTGTYQRVTDRALEFLDLWKKQDWKSMLSMCAADWRVRIAEPEKGLENIASFLSPELITMYANAGSSASAEYTVFCAVTHREDPASRYILQIAMKKQGDGLWYVDPESLRDYEAVPEDSLLSPLAEIEQRFLSRKSDDAKQTEIWKISEMLRTFLEYWQTDNRKGMLELCVSDGEYAAPDVESILDSLTGFLVPQYMNIVEFNNADGDELAKEVLCFVYSKNVSRYSLTFTVRKQANGAWLVDPAPLRNLHDVLIPDFYAGDDYMLRLRYNYPGLADRLVPVGLSCESAGIRLKIISMAVAEDESLIVYSLEDMTGERIASSHISGGWLNASNSDEIFDHGAVTYLNYNDSGNSFILAQYNSGGTLTASPDHLVTVALEPVIELYSDTRIDLMPLFRDYGDRSGALVDAPENLWGYSSGPDDPKTTDEYFREQKMKVLDTSASLEIPLCGHVLLSGIGIKDDGMLHVQLHLVDNGNVTDDRNHTYSPVMNVKIWCQDQEGLLDYPASPVYWQDESNPDDTWMEFLFSVDPDKADILWLDAAINLITDVIHGTWEVQIPLDTVLAADPE